MANIAILNYCNLQCPYCFANKFIAEEDKELITDEQLDKILAFLDKDAKPGAAIGIIGGEPTIHPNFRNIVQKIDSFSREHNFVPPIIYTNGILLGDYVDVLYNLRVLVNINSPDVIGKTNWDKLNHSLKRFEAYNALDALTFGINLHPNLTDFNYFLDLASKFRQSEIRCSYVAPTCQFEHVNKDKYYEDAKPLFLSFCREAIKRGIKVHLDCNHIPECFFTEAELSELEGNVVHWHNYCNPVVDITPDMKASACFGAYNLVDMSKFDTFSDLLRYFTLHDLYAANLKNKTGKCADCAKFDNLSCQGGCLAFTRE